MAGTMRTLVTIVCESALEARLTDDLMRLGAHGCTVTDARGQGSRGVRNAGWDAAANIRVEVVCDDPTAERICAHLHAHYYRNFAMILFTMPVQVLRPEKF